MDFAAEQQPYMVYLGGLGNGFLHSVVHFLLVVDAPVAADAAGAESLDEYRSLRGKSEEES